MDFQCQAPFTTRQTGGIRTLNGFLRTELQGAQAPSAQQPGLHCNQIYLATLRPTQLTQASFLQKNQMLQYVFFDICNAKMSQWQQKS